MDSSVIVRAMQKRQPVMYNGTKYKRIQEYVLWFDHEGKRRLSLVLVDQTNRATVRAPADQVEILEG